MINNLAKYILYNVFHKEYSFNSKIILSYVFHTEKIHDDLIYSTLLSFVKAYLEITNKKCILTVMTPMNYQIKQEMRDVQCSVQKYADRIYSLSEYAVIGYHGHFYSTLDTSDEIKGNIYDDSAASMQFDNEVEWLAKYFPGYSKAYSAGWWYLSDTIINKLIEHNFKFDFSFSYSPYFGCNYSKKIMSEYDIKFGETFAMNDGSDIKYVQNFIGCHDSKYPQDFIRRFNYKIRFEDLILRSD